MSKNKSVLLLSLISIVFLPLNKSIYAGCGLLNKCTQLNSQIREDVYKGTNLKKQTYPSNMRLLLDSLKNLNEITQGNSIFNDLSELSTKTDTLSLLSLLNLYSKEESPQIKACLYNLKECKDKLNFSKCANRATLCNNENIFLKELPGALIVDSKIDDKHIHDSIETIKLKQKDSVVEFIKQIKTHGLIPYIKLTSYFTKTEFPKLKIDEPLEEILEIENEIKEEVHPNLSLALPTCTEHACYVNAQDKADLMKPSCEPDTSYVRTCSKQPQSLALPTCTEHACYVNAQDKADLIEPSCKPDTSYVRTCSTQVQSLALPACTEYTCNIKTEHHKLLANRDTHISPKSTNSCLEETYIIKKEKAALSIINRGTQINTIFTNTTPVTVNSEQRDLNKSLNNSTLANNTCDISDMDFSNPIKSLLYSRSFAFIRNETPIFQNDSNLLNSEQVITDQDSSSYFAFNFMESKAFSYIAGAVTMYLAQILFKGIKAPHSESRLVNRNQRIVNHMTIDGYAMIKQRIQDTFREFATEQEGALNARRADMATLLNLLEKIDTGASDAIEKGLALIQSRLKEKKTFSPFRFKSSNPHEDVLAQVQSILEGLRINLDELLHSENASPISIVQRSLQETDLSRLSDNMINRDILQNLALSIIQVLDEEESTTSSSLASQYIGEIEKFLYSYFISSFNAYQ